MILVLTDRDRDYGPDYLTHGFAALCGATNVVDWPRKLSLHWRDEPVFDCDVNIDSLTHTRRMGQDEVEDALSDCIFDLIIVPTLRGSVPQRLYFWRELLALNADRLVYYDAEDHAEDTRPLFVSMAGVAPAAYFKRELPLGATWARPLAFGYPAERAVPADTEREIGFVYAVQLWPWAIGGLREKLEHELDRLAWSRANVACDKAVAFREGDKRWSVMEYRDVLRASQIAVSPAGQGWGTNRHLEIVAAGCAPVIEAPCVQWPDAFEAMTECIYFVDEREAVEAVQWLLQHPDYARALASAAQAKFLAAHTTRHRALAVWEAVHGTWKGGTDADTQARGGMVP